MRVGGGRAGTHSPLVGGEQELDFEEDPEGEAARGARKGGAERLPEATGCMRAPSWQTWERGSEQRGLGGIRGALREEGRSRSLGCVQWRAPGSPQAPGVSEAMVEAGV